MENHPRPHFRHAAGGQWGRVGIFQQPSGLEAQLPQLLQRHGTGGLFSGRDLSLQLGLGFSVKPKRQKAGGHGCCSQQADNESANRSSRVDATSQSERSSQVHISCRECLRVACVRKSFRHFELAAGRLGRTKLRGSKNLRDCPKS